MKVIMLRPSYKPDLSAGNHLAINLVDDLIERGFEVELIVPSSHSTELNPKEPYQVFRVKSFYSGNNKFGRMLRYVETSIKMFIKLIKTKDIGVIVSHSMPPLIGPLCVLAGKIKRKPVVYWEQDIVSQSILTTNFSKNRFVKKILFTISKYLETISVKGSTHVITISKKFKDYHVAEGVNNDRIDVIYNWIDSEEIYPIARNENPLYVKYGLDKSKFYVTYCGNLGVPQNVEIMIEAAELLKNVTDIQFIIIGGGSRESEVKEYLYEKKLNNFKIYPLEPLSNARLVYNLGDVGLVIAKSGTSKNGFPSKTGSILAAGQTIISCFDLESELSDFVNESNSGIAIEPDSSTELSDAILRMYENCDFPGKKNLKARKYAIQNFSRKQSTKQFIDIIESVI